MMILNRGNRKNFIRISALIFVFVLALSCTVICSAEETPYDSYYFTVNGEIKTYEVDKPMYKVERMLNGQTLNFDGFFEVTDMFCAADDLVYILDSLNSRIVVVDEKYTVVRTLNHFTYNGAVQELAKPQGLFVTDSGQIYIADTENSRVLLCDADGHISKMITLPESDLIPKDFDFFPIRILCDHNGFLYIVTRGSYYGAMLFDSDDEFIGFFGSNTVTTSVLEGLKGLVTGLFETNEKLAVTAKKLPFQFSDFDIDRDGFFYTVSSNTEKSTGQIRKINLAGNDILSYRDNMENKSSITYNFGENKNYFDKSGREYPQNFCSISVDDGGYIFALDSVYGKIYVYDADCKSITVFGGGLSSGNLKGTFDYATSVETVGENVWVSDAHTNEITVFSLTDYGRLVKMANTCTLNNDHTAAEPLWQQVLKQNNHSALAFLGLTKAALSRNDHKAVFRYAELANDKESYAIAFDVLKKNYISENLWWIACLVLVLIAVLVAIRIILHKKQIVLIKNDKARLFVKSLVHPFDAFEEIKYKKKYSKWISIICLIMFFVSKVGSDLWCGFMYRDNVRNYNVLYSLFGTVGVVLLWVIVEWAVSALFQGNAHAGEVFCVTCYSLVPMIVYHFFYIGYSYLFAPSGTSFLNVINIAFVLYTAVLLCAGLITIHEYSFGKVVGTTVLTMIGMMIVAFVTLMMLSLGQNLVAFFVNIFSEVNYR